MIVKKIKECTQLSNFLKNHSQDFPISLDKKIDITEYSKKLIKSGEVIGIIENNMLYGVIAGYYNDLETREAYISILILDKSLRGKGLSKKILQEFTNQCKLNKMETILVYTNHLNKEAIGLYKKSGFKDIAKIKDDIKFIKRIEV